MPPKLRILSPAFKPAASAGLPETTLLTVVKGVSMRFASVALLPPGTEGSDREAGTGCEFVTCAAA